MMNKYDTDDTFLGRWISGDLSEEERIAFEKTDVFKQCSIINRESQLLEGPSIDIEKAWNDIKLKLEKKKVKSLKAMRLGYSVAAAVLLIISSGIFLSSSKTYISAIGETANVVLDDGTVINLNSNSKLSHKRFFWKNNKKVHLEGEAYFTVVKGNEFEVITSKGTIAVLGTEFNVRDRKELEVKCYEGKVGFSVSTIQNPYILSKGMQLTVNEKELLQTKFSESSPSWKGGYSIFRNEPLFKVLEELTYLYPVEFDVNSIDTTSLFTGSFPHNNLEVALKTTLNPMGIIYDKSSTGDTIILSK